MILRVAPFLAMCALLVASMVYLKTGIDMYKGSMNEKEQFSKFEHDKTVSLPGYADYAKEGHRIFLEPYPTVALFSESLVSNSLIAKIDTGEKLRMNESFRGKKLFADRAGGDKGFSGFLFLYGGLLSLYYGFSSFRGRKYIPMLSSVGGFQKIYWLIALSRIIIIAFYFLLVFAAAVSLMLINSIPLTGAALGLIFFLCLGLILVMIFLFSLGILVAMISNKPLAVVVLVVTWICITSWLPKAFNAMSKRGLNQINSEYQFDMKGLNIAIEFEKYAVETFGKYKSSVRKTEIAAKIAKKYLSNNFNQVMMVDEKLHKQCIDHVVAFQRASVFAPATFYLSISDDISSIGKRGKLKFWDFVRAFKWRVVPYLINKKLLTTEEKIQNFVKHSENIMTSVPELPPYFFKGLIISVSYTLLSLLIGAVSFKWNLLKVPGKEMKEFSVMKLESSEKEKLFAFMVKGDSFQKVVFKWLSANLDTQKRKNASIDILLDGKPLLDLIKGRKVLYTCSPADLPGRYLKDFVFLTGYLNRLKRKDILQFISDRALDDVFNAWKSDESADAKAKLMLALTRCVPYDIYLIGEIAVGLPEEEAFELMNSIEGLTLGGNIALYFITRDIFNVSKNNGVKKFPFQKRSWFAYYRQLKWVKEEERS